MEVKQIYLELNELNKQLLGANAISQVDATNLVTFGTELFNANQVDNYVRKLVDRIGVVMFVDRQYTGEAQDVMMLASEWGSVIEKISPDLPELTENESWELQNGASYDDNIFYAPKVSVKFYNHKTTFEIPISFTREQVKESFLNEQELTRFVACIETSINNAITLGNENAVKQVLNVMSAETINEGAKTRAINLLAEYNAIFTGATLTASACIYNKDFLKYATARMNEIMKSMKSMKTIFNMGKKARHTPKELLHVTMLDKFEGLLLAYLESDTFHNELVKLEDRYQTISCWQGVGQESEGLPFDEVSKIDIKTESGVEVEQSGILAVAWDRDAVGVYNYDRRTNSKFNNKAEFYSYWHKVDCGYFADKNENFVVFYVAD